MIVLGSQFGDEGKGLTTSFLCSLVKNPLVVRFNGGHQAGHTVVFNGKRHVFSSFGSGTLQGVPTYWSKFCTFYPTSFLNERKLLNDPVIYVNPLCPVTTPYDIECNRRRELIAKHGSVGVGFGATIERQEKHYKLFVQDLFYENILLEKLKNINNNYYHYNVDIFNFLKDCREVIKYIKLSNDEIFHNFTPIFEGAQGILLDQDFGFFPNVTRSNTTSKNALSLYPHCKEVFYVTRTYQTRHGNGFMTNEGKEDIHLVNNENETNTFKSGLGKLRISKLDVDLLNYAYQCDNYFSSKLIKNLVITCTDQLEIDIEKVINNINTRFNKIYISKGNSLNDIVPVKFTYKNKLNS